MDVITNFEPSNIASIKYHKAIGTLQLSFHNGSIHEYLNVPLETWQKLSDSEYKIKFIKLHILKQHKSLKTTKLRASELYLIALAIHVEPCDMLNALYSDLKGTLNINKTSK